MIEPSKSSGIDTESIKAATLKDLLDVVDSVRGKKALVLDPTLTGPLGLVVKFSLLKDHGIDKVYHLEPSPLVATHEKIIYICRPQQKNAKMILGNIITFASLLTETDQIRTKASDIPFGQREFHVYFVPRKTSTCVDVLEQGGVLGDIVLGELPLLFLPLEQDLLSLELEGAFKELYFVHRLD